MADRPPRAGPAGTRPQEGRQPARGACRRSRDPPGQRPRGRLLSRPDRSGAAGVRSSARASARPRARHGPVGRGLRLPRLRPRRRARRASRIRASTRSHGAGSSRPRPRHRRRRVRPPRRRGAGRPLQRPARPPARAGRVPRRSAGPLRPQLRRAHARWHADAAADEAGIGRRRAQPVSLDRHPRPRGAARLRRGARRSSSATGEPDLPSLRWSRVPASATAGPRRRAACSGTATSSTTTAPSSTPGSCRRRRRTSRASNTTSSTSSQRHLDLPDDELGRRAEQVIRNYDPCISCATHFLDLTVDRT